MTQVAVSVGQMDVQRGNPRANWEKMQQMTAEAKRQGGQFVVFPELWDAGFALDKVKDLASSISGGLFAQVASLAKQQSIFITGSMLEKRGVGVCNTAPIFSPQSGVVGVYRKIHLFPLMQEDLYFSAGEAPLNIGLPWGQTGVAICYDLRFPELFRRYALEGAKLIVVPCEWPQPRLEHYRTLLRARAIENGMYIVAVNRVGTDVDQAEGGEKRTEFFGHSTIVDPWGEIVFEAGSTEGVYTAVLDLTMVDEVRQRIPVLDNRRPETYGNF